MNFRVLLLIITSSISSLQSMEHNKPITYGQLMINKNTAKSAAYGSKELHTVINATGIPTHPFDILIPVKTEPAVEGMPSYLPIKEIELCSTGTRLPFVINEQKIILTCANNPASKLPFEQHCQKYLSKFNETPQFAYNTSYKNEYPELRETLIKNNLIKPTPQAQIGNRNFSRQIIFTIPTHKNFKPYTPKRNNHKTITNRQITSKR